MDPSEADISHCQEALCSAYDIRACYGLDEHLIGLFRNILIKLDMINHDCMIATGAVGIQLDHRNRTLGLVGVGCRRVHGSGLQVTIKAGKDISFS